jgi:hypothetical protein
LRNIQRVQESKRQGIIDQPAVRHIATYFGVPDEMAGAGTMSRLGGYSPEGERLRHAGQKAILEELEGINKIF